MEQLDARHSVEILGEDGKRSRNLLRHNEIAMPSAKWMRPGETSVTANARLGPPTEIASL
jgi:hypothetical protein